MSNENIQSSFGFELIHEVNKMKSIIVKIKDEIRKSAIERLLLKEYIFDLAAASKTISVYLTVISPNLEEKNYIGETRKSVIGVYDQLSLGLMNYAQQIDDDDKFPDTKIRNDIFTLITGCTADINSFETYLMSLDLAISPYAKILEFVATKPMGLDEKWTAAACYLSAFDIMINKTRETLKIAKKPEEEKKLDFYTKFDEVVKVLEAKKGELSKIVKQFPKVFWQIRVDVIHYGYVPSHEELDLIINWSKNIMKIISEE